MLCLPGAQKGGDRHVRTGVARSFCGAVACQCNYQSYDELVEEALRLLQEREAEADRIAEKLRPAAESFTRGEPGIPFDAEDVIRRGMQRLSARDSTA
jgi:Arc/MetJ-type ribon-helix-helix transcriptional regulator